MAKFFPRAPVQRWALRIFMASSAMAEVWFSQELWTGGAGGHVFKQRFGLTYKLQSTATARRRFWVCRFMCPPVNEVTRPKAVHFNLHVVWFCQSKFSIFLKFFESPYWVMAAAYQKCRETPGGRTVFNRRGRDELPETCRGSYFITNFWTILSRVKRSRATAGNLEENAWCFFYVTCRYD